ncbi:hypothetical protein T439DRAFT_327810 [Meredithblackwellia eburnea MCA 4105]
MRLARCTAGSSSLPLLTTVRGEALSCWRSESGRFSSKLTHDEVRLPSEARRKHSNPMKTTGHLSSPLLKSWHLFTPPTLHQTPVPTSSLSSTRHFSSTPSTSFLFRRPNAPSASKILEEISEATSKNRVDLVARLYPQFMSAVKKLDNPLPRKGNYHRFKEAMQLVSKSPNRLPLLRRMFADLSVLGFEPQEEDHAALLVGLSRSGIKSGSGRGGADTALKWVESMRETHGIVPNVKHWNIVVGGFQREGDTAGIRRVMKKMEEAQLENSSVPCGPNTVTYNTLLSALFSAGNVAEAREARREMDKVGVPSDLWTESTLLSGFLTASEFGSAREVQERLQPLVARWTSPEEVDVTVMNNLIRYAASVDGFPAGLKLAEEFRDMAYPLDDRSLAILADKGKKGREWRTAKQGIEFIERIEEVTGRMAGKEVWSIVLAEVLRTGDGLESAMEVFQEAKDRSIHPDATMVHPLINFLVKIPTRKSLEQARKLYDDLASSPPSSGCAPDMWTYNTLLRASANPACADLDFSRTILTDMRERGLQLESDTVAWYIISLMRVARDWEDAFAQYDTVRALDPLALDTRAYNVLIAAFTSLPLSDSTTSFAPPQLILEFLTDMRRTNNYPNAVTYSTLLSYYSASSSASPSLISHLHSLIKLDTNLDPDVPLFNSLMDAYSRVGAYESAFRIWDTLRANSRGSNMAFNDASVSIVLDTCGFANDEVRARLIWDGLRREGFPLTEAHWDTWVECLCRLGKESEAVELILDPSKNMLRRRPVETVLRLTQGSGKVPEFRAEIKKLMPELWISWKPKVEDASVPGDEQSSQVPPTPKVSSGRF